MFMVVKKDNLVRVFILMELLKSIFATILVILLLPIALVTKSFGKAITRSNDEVENILMEMASGKVDDHLWDSFLSIPIKNKELDNIREQVEILWAYDEFQEKNEDGMWVLNKCGLKELSGLINELRSLKNT